MLAIVLLWNKDEQENDNKRENRLIANSLESVQL